MLLMTDRQVPLTAVPCSMAHPSVQIPRDADVTIQSKRFDFVAFVPRAHRPKYFDIA